MDTGLQRILKADLSDEQFVRQVLARLEAMTRRIALIGIAEWNSFVIEESSLFEVVERLIRPAWGSWNQLIDALLKTVGKQISSSSSDIRGRLEQSCLHQNIHPFWNMQFPHETKDLLAAFAPYTSKQSVAKITFAVIVRRLTEVRNRIAHDSPTGNHYWAGLALACRPLVKELCEVSSPPWLESKVDISSPWLYRKDDRVFEYNGLNNDLSASYVDYYGNRETSEQCGVEIVSAFELILGRSTIRAENLAKLLAEIRPDDNRGVVLDDFLIQDVAGQGAFAVVYSARQLSTGLRVAVKILRDGLDEDTISRFKREARYLGRVQHPNVVQVIARGEGHWSRHPELEPTLDWFQKDFKLSAKLKHYIAMEWIDGKTLEEIFKQPSRLEPRDLALWFEQATAALSVIHAHGLIHRDIKPSNLMVTTGGIVKLMDLGVAKAVQGGATKYTSVGTAIGTPAYMSPEQVRAMELEAEIGPPSDIYSLCATFYELFTGHRLFAHDTVPEFTVIRAKREGLRPIAARVYDKNLVQEINSILMGGLEPEVGDRYQTTESLLADIRHYLKDEPIEHELPSLIRRVQLAYRRNRRLANLTITFVLITVFGSAVYLHLIQTERNRTRQRYTDLLFERAREELQSQKPLQASVYLAEVMKYGRDTTPVRVLLGLAMPAIDAQQVSLGGSSDPIGGTLVFSADSHLLSAMRLNKVSLWDVNDGRLIRVIDPSTNCGNNFGSPSAIFSPGGTWLLVCNGSEARILSGDGSLEHCTLSGHDLDVIGAAFSTDEHWVATTSVDDTAKLWSLPGCRLQTTLRGHKATVNSVSFSSTNQLLLTTSNDGSVRLWRLPSGELVRIFHNPGETPIQKASLLTPGEALVARGEALTLWDTETGQVRLSLPSLTGSTIEFGVSGRGNTAIVQTAMNSLPALYDLGTGQVIKSFDHRFITSVAYDNRGDRIAIGGQDQVVKIYDAHGGSEIATFSSHTGAFPVLDVAFDQSGKLLASTDGMGGVKVWKLSEHRIPALDLHKAILVESGLNANQLWTIYRNGQVAINRGFDGQSSSKSLESEGIVDAVMYPDGSKIALWGANGTLSLWRTSDARLIWRVFSTVRPIRKLEFGVNTIDISSGILHFSGSGKMIFVVGGDGNLEGFNTSDGKKLGSFYVTSAAINIHDIYCPDDLNRCLAIGSREEMPSLGVVEILYDYADQRVIQLFKGHKEPYISSAVFSRDGTRVITAGADRTARVFYTSTGIQQAVFLGHGDGVTAADLNPENSLAVTASTDGVVRLWDTDTSALLHTFATGITTSAIHFDRTGRIIWTEKEGGLDVFTLPYEDRDQKQLEDQIASKVPWIIRGGRLDEVARTGSASVGTLK